MINIKNLKIGKKFSKQILLKDSDILNFAKLTKDLHLLHSDDNFAVSKGFSKKIVQGALLMSLSISLITHKMIGFHYLISDTKFKYLNPTYPNKKIKINLKISELNLKFKVATVEILICTNSTINCKGHVGIKLNF